MLNLLIAAVYIKNQNYINWLVKKNNTKQNQVYNNYVDYIFIPNYM